MPKKSRRTKAKHRGKLAKTIKERQPQAVKPQVTAPRPQPQVTAPRLQAKVPFGTQDFSSRYQHMMPELRYIAILGGSIILALIVLSFILG